jgi:hypothetical protein
MKVRMTVDVSGNRNGEDWPPKGSVIDMPDDEAIGYVEANMALPITTYANSERAVIAEDPTVELRTEAPPAVEVDPARVPLPRNPGKEMRGQQRR